MAVGLGSIWLSESIIYAHATLFMLVAAWALREGGHVRVDETYAGCLAPQQGDGRSRAARCSLLRPFMAGAPLVCARPMSRCSWAILERSRETSGIPAVFLLKTLIPLFAVTMALQGIAQAMRATHALKGARW